MENKTLLKNILREIRDNKGLSRSQISELTGIPFETIKSWELGRAKPTVENLRILADYYDVSVDYILGRTENPKINK